MRAVLETKKEDDSCETNNKETGKCQVHFFNERDRIQIMTKATLLQKLHNTLSITTLEKKAQAFLTKIKDGISLQERIKSVTDIA